ncbi:hypothetical protein D3C87_1696230 [compost metagenome]
MTTIWRQEEINRPRPLRINLIELGQAAVRRIDTVSNNAAMLSPVKVRHFAGDIQRLAFGIHGKLCWVRLAAGQGSGAQCAADRIDLHPVNAFAVRVVSTDISKMR